MSIPLFSVVIPTFNRNSLLCRTLRSVYAQTFQDFEVVVVDDGSTDGTLDTLAKDFSRVRTFAQRNLGPSAARNLGWARAAGKYVVFLDSDDLLFPWSLTTYRNVILAHDCPAVVCGSPHVFSDEDSLRAVTAKTPVVRVFRDYASSAGEPIWVGAGALAVRRSVAVRFPESIRWSEDLHLFFSLSVEPGFVKVDSPPLLAYRFHGGNVTMDVARGVAGLTELAHSEKADRFPGGAARAQERRELICRFFRCEAVAAVRAGHWRGLWPLYVETWAWQARLGRFRFLFGWPVLAIWGAVRELIFRAEPQPRLPVNFGEAANRAINLKTTDHRSLKEKRQLQRHRVG